MIIRDGIFRKSDGSDTGGCVEVAGLPGGGVQVRDTKDRDGGTQTYTDHEWTVLPGRAPRAASSTCPTRANPGRECPVIAMMAGPYAAPTRKP